MVVGLCRLTALCAANAKHVSITMPSEAWNLTRSDDAVTVEQNKSCQRNGLVDGDRDEYHRN